MSATAYAPLPDSRYWEQFFSALSCRTSAEAEKWMTGEVSRYMTQFALTEEIAWRTIACNLGYFAGYYGSGAVLVMRRLFGIFPECFDEPGYRQEKRRAMNGSGTPASDSPV